MKLVQGSTERLFEDKKSKIVVLEATKKFERSSALRFSCHPQIRKVKLVSIHGEFFTFTFLCLAV